MAYFQLQCTTSELEMIAMVTVSEVHIGIQMARILIQT